ncbi:MAG: putative PEP-binding protein, partial [Pseudomonadota bacterium]
NDLQQFFFAADRVNERVSDRYDALSTPLLRALSHVLQTATAHGTPVSLCGEIAGKPLEAMALIGLGLRRISMAPASVGPIKVMVRSLHVGHLATFLDEVLAGADHDVRSALTTYARENAVALDLDAVNPIALMSAGAGQAAAG